MKREDKLMALRQDMKKIGPYLHSVSKEIIENKVSKYPIFVVHKEPSVSLGRVVLQSSTSGTIWTYSASLLEEFVKREIVGKENVADFRDVYKDANMFACFFLLTPEDMEFIFCPYDLDADIKGLL